VGCRFCGLIPGLSTGCPGSIHLRHRDVGDLYSGSLKMLGRCFLIQCLMGSQQVVDLFPPLDQGSQFPDGRRQRVTGMELIAPDAVGPFHAAVALWAFRGRHIEGDPCRLAGLIELALEFRAPMRIARIQGQCARNWPRKSAPQRQRSPPWVYKVYKTPIRGVFPSRRLSLLPCRKCKQDPMLN